MDLRLGAEHEAFRAELREFLAGWPLDGAEAELPLEEQERLFRRRGIERGYVYRHIPVEYGGAGREPDVLAERIIQEEYLAAGAPGDVSAQGPSMLVPTLLEKGTEAQRRRFIRPTLNGEMVWCQGYSEPGAGSDLASLQSRAVLDGDEWVIDGHKIWTSGAQRAHYMFGLFRTEPEAPRHAGISYLLIDMSAPGIEIRPLREITGGAVFNEVFLNEVRTPADHIVGRRGEGWLVSRATLKHERKMIGDPNALRRLFVELLELARTTERGGRPATADPGVRQRLSEIEGYLLSQESAGRLLLTAAARGESESPRTALPLMMMKLYSTHVRERISRLAYDLIGSGGLLAPSDEEQRVDAGNTPGSWTSRYMLSLAVAIAGGASNIQRNIVGERGLGLPRDLRASR